MEMWKSVRGYEGIYEISNHGNVKSLARETVHKDGKVYMSKDRILKPIDMGLGYRGFQLSKNTVVTRFYEHRLVALHFVDGHNDELQVNHKNGKKKDNHYTNLEWVTASENLLHAMKIGLVKQYGEDNHMNKFSDDIVIRIRKKYEIGTHTQAELARLFKISPMQIHRIVRYKNRKIVRGKEAIKNEFNN